MPRLRKRLRDSLLIVPLIGLIGGWALASGAIQLDTFIYELDERWQDVDLRDLWFLRTAADLGAAAKAALGTMSSAMLTFIGVVFSISLVALQMAAGQFTPRVVRIYIESWVTKTTLAVFLCTFLYTLRVQKEYASGNDANDTVVPYVGASLAMGFMVASLVLFVVYVNSTVRLMRVTHVMDRVTRESLRLIETLPGADGAGEEPAHTCDLSQAAVLAHRGRPGVLQAVHEHRAVRLAERQGLTLHLVPQAGDYLCPGEPLFLVCGGGPDPGPDLQQAVVDIGVERTTEQDVGFGLRQLVDIAVRALSAAVNDPTTAVQSLDRIQVLLAALARRPLGMLVHRDGEGVVRLVVTTPQWPELLDLALSEIQDYGIDSAQVTRRLAALFDALDRSVPDGRRAALAARRARLEEAVRRSQPDVERREFALHADRQGIG
ncbi:DUF2254 domain-containing protein [Streptomyces monticola]|uniref:DUF2254 domain-containing protein n=1 Tax=Streptomyces monticola TaxID=2666263 RepID=A0ABW2JEG1_9ACTN